MLLHLVTGDHSRAERALSEALKKLTEWGQLGRCTELQMIVGDYYWEAGRRLRYRALQHYLGAMISEPVGEATFRVGARMVRRLMSLYPTPGIHSLISLRRQLRKYLKRAGADGHGVKVMLWPFAVAKELMDRDVSLGGEPDRAQSIAERVLRSVVSRG